MLVFSVKMIVDTVRTLIGTSETKEEKDALAALCKEEPVVEELKDVRLHDYGYRAKFGVAYVSFSPDSTEEERTDAVGRIIARLKEETGATVEIVPYKIATE